MRFFVLLGGCVSDRTRDLLWLIGGIVGILLVSVTWGVVLFYLLNGSIPIPEATRTNFWSLVNTLLIPTAFGWIAWKIRQQIEHSQENTKKIEQAQKQIADIDSTIKNGGGAGVKQIQATVDRLLEQSQRDPEQRTRADDQPFVDPDRPSEMR